ncbi:MAG: AIR synthase-related protein, partial [bacterium]|nr:AIR synthase-related protein [bacterium]
MIQVVRVGQKDLNADIRGQGVKSEAERTLGIKNLDSVRTAKVYRLEGINESQVKKLAKTLFCEEINQKFTLNTPLLNGTKHVVEVAYQPGVMNPEVASVLKSAKDLKIKLSAADSSTEYAFYGKIKPQEIEEIVSRILVNKTVERVVYDEPETLIIAGKAGQTETVFVRGAADEKLMGLSTDKLFLSLEEMKVIQNYFLKIGRDPTDCELEIIAAWWSEHCGHKTFKARVITGNDVKPPLIERIRKTAQKYFGDLVISAFEDNSGVMKFYDGMAICGKVETHNSPSAIEPYGGAMTGSGGVFRDTLGTGQGAKVIVSTDMFCFAPPEMSDKKLPVGCLNPDYLLRRVVSGVRDYGNRTGIPTNNGSVHFHDDFRAKPTVIVGSYGIIPVSRAKKGAPKPGDLVVLVGGRTGRDGIHGATFSSGEMTDQTINVNGTAVQIGNAIEEKRVIDAILEARDENLIRAITDCGAAGISSAIGELGKEIGVEVDISRVPLKYPGLSPWEIFLSEAQERMVLAVSPKNIKKFLEITKKYNVESTILGEFNKSRKLRVNYGKKKVAELGYQFLENGLPQRVMKTVALRYSDPAKKGNNPIVPKTEKDWIKIIKKVLSHGNVCSKEPIVRQYDHGVQGTSALSPFSGINNDSPNDAVVISPILGKPYGLVKSHGMNPVLNKIDPYWGSVWAITEAMSNYVAVGGDYREACLINNYIWPSPDEESMGSLDKSVDAVVDMMRVLKRPVISGKDSLSSTYRGKDGKVLKIPPVLCISVFGRIADVNKTVTSDIKKVGSTLCLVGKLSNEMGGSTYYDVNRVLGSVVPRVDSKLLPKVFRKIHQGIVGGKIISCHDVSEGGVITTIAEMCFGG